MSSFPDGREITFNNAGVDGIHDWFSYLVGVVFQYPNRDWFWTRVLITW